jgi:two-component system phosphate regulon sensor histidine kinase PhoR
VPARIPRRFLPLFVIVPLVLAAATILGRYSYRYATQLAEKSEQSVAESNRLLGDQTLDRIDNFIIDSDRSLFDLVDLEHLGDFEKQWSKIVRLSPAIEAAIVLDESLRVMPNGYVSKKRTVDAEAFRGLFMTQILPDLPLADLKPDLHKHMHRAYDGHDYLISFIKRERNGRSFYVVLKISLEYLLKNFIPDELEPLEGKVVVGIRDDHGRLIYGADVGKPGRFLYERAFPTTLYLWRLQLAPPRAEALVREEYARRRFEQLLIASTLVIMVVCTAFLVYAWEKERRANQLKSDFISNVSHELKTPLSLIRMFGELLALGKLKSPDKAKEYAEIITRESERLGRLIDNVLDFSRMERGRVSYDFQPGRLDEVVERSLDVYRHRVEREGFKLVTKIDAGLPETELDENAMTLLLLNLLENAVKYGKGEIAVYLTRVGDLLRLVVGDQGPGIPRDEQKRIFDRFYRTRQARGTNVRGSGIGLALVKHIAEAHGGRVTVESEPGKGAAFIVDLPLERHREAA